jgi:hypothetical protein
MYHFLDDGSGRHPFRPAEQSYTLDARLFEDHLDSMLGAGYETVSLNRYLGACRGQNALPPRPIIITFDDGHASVREFAVELLRARRLTATAFLVTGKVGTPGYLTWKDIACLVAAGLEVGSHTVSHRPLTALSDEELHTELTASRKAIVEHVKPQHCHLSLPHGFGDRRVIAAALDCYDTVCTSEFAVNDPRHGPRVLARMAVRQGTTTDMLRRMLNERSMLHRRLRFLDMAKRPLKRRLPVRECRHRTTEGPQ